MAKVLIIDDDDLVRQSVSSQLERQGFDVVDAADGRSGQQMADRLMPDLIICDVIMKYCDGYATLERIRSNPKTSAIPVILMTGMATSKGMRHGMNRGADDYLAKPFTNDELISAVNACLQKNHLVRQQSESRLREIQESLGSMLPHELRTPLIGILGFSEILKAEAETLKPEEIFEMASDILSSAKRLHRSVENFLVYSENQSILSDEARRARVLKGYFAEPARTIERIARMKAARYDRGPDLSLECQTARIAMPPRYLSKLTEELVDNAFKFSEPGTVVEVKSSVNAANFEMTVSDQGRGMPPAQVQAVEAYRQFDRDVYEQQGAGLGLALVRQIVSIFTGHLEIKSQVKMNTSVRIVLPVGQAE